MFRFVASLLLACAAGHAAAALPPDELFKLVSPSVWRVSTTAEDGRPLSLGSGVVTAPETLVTNCHVLRRAASVTIRHGTSTLRARLLHADTERDLCELKVAGLQAPAVMLAPDPARVGQRVYTIGTPRGLDTTLSDGLVSGIRPDAPGGGYIQISAPISPGSSGGGLFDEDGRLLGITTSGIAGVAQNLNFAKPAALIADIPSRSAAALQRWRDARAAGTSSADALAPWTPVPSPIPMPTIVSIERVPPGRGTTPTAPPSAVVPPSAAAVPPASRASDTTPQPRRIASGYAAIDDIDAIPYLNDRGREGYRAWLGRSTPRAFALASNGRWASSSGVRGNGTDELGDPSDRALANCQRVANMPCKLYAVNNAVVWVKEPAAPALAAPAAAAPAPAAPEATAPAKP